MRTITRFLLICFLSSPGPLLAKSLATVSGALNVSALQPGQTALLAVVIDIASGYHAQSHTPLDEYAIKCELTLQPFPGIEFGTIGYPDGKIEDYPNLGKLSVYTGRAIILVPVTVSKDVKADSVKLSGSVEVQICNNDTCFPPEDDAFAVEAKIVPAGSPVEPRNETLFPKEPTTQPQKAQTPLAPQQGGDPGTNRFSLFGVSGQIHSVFGAYFAAFIAGLIFNLMPCVLPVLPLKAIGFYEVSQHNRARTILLGSVFSLGVITMFAGLAVFVLLSKQVFGRQFSWGQQFSNLAFVWTISLILVALARV